MEEPVSDQTLATAQQHLLERVDSLDTMELIVIMLFVSHLAKTVASVLDQITVHVKELDMQDLCVNMMRMNA
jgi:hypothetical protein